MMDETTPEPSKQAIMLVAKGPRKLPSPLWLVCCLGLGVVASTMVPSLAVAIQAFAMRGFYEVKGTKGFLAALVEVVVLVGLTSLQGAAVALVVAMLSFCAAGIVWCMRKRRATVLGVSAVIVVTALLSMGIDGYFIAQQGGSLDSAYTQMLMEAARASVGTSIQADILLSQMEPLVKVLWPFVYVGSAGVNAFIAGLGSFLMSARAGHEQRFPSIAAFDAPVWAVGVLALSVLGIGASFSEIPAAMTVRTVCVTALMSIRIVFALQGFGVATSWMSRRRLGCITRFIAIFLILWIETMFFAVSIVGLIDVWANFRKLPRDGAHTGANS